MECSNLIQRDDLAIVEALPSLYPLQEFETDAVRRVVMSSGGGWIPVSERLPEVETEVLIYARRKYKGGDYKDIITTAMYEDGTMRDNDSSWNWEDLDGEWDEEADCMIIQEGWWENKHYNPDGVLNYRVDDEVVAWQPLPEAYKDGER